MNKNSPNSSCLYKYTKKEYCKAMINGEFFINTLDSLRNYEETHSEIGDKGEGTKTIYADKVNFHTSKPETLQNIPEFAKNWIQGAGISVINCTFAQKNNENFYVFSCSKEHNPKIMKKLGYDSCIKIINPNEFFREITASLQSMNLTSHNFFGGECNYEIARKEHHQNISGIHPAIVKPQRYAYQQEVRVIWIPSSKQIKPEKIISKATKKYIEII